MNRFATIQTDRLAHHFQKEWLQLRTKQPWYIKLLLKLFFASLEAFIDDLIQELRWNINKANPEEIQAKWDELKKKLPWWKSGLLCIVEKLFSQLLDELLQRLKS